MSELEVLKAKWEREDYVKEREKKNEIKIKQQKEKEYNDLMKKSNKKRNQARENFLKIFSGKNNTKKEVKKEVKKDVKKINEDNDKEPYYDDTSFDVAYTSTVFKYSMSVLMLFLNLLAVSISLNCNKDNNIILKIILAVLAFFFSIPYIIIHFLRIVIFKKEVCSFSNVKFFA